MDLLPIDEINTMGRVLREDDDVEALAKSILDEGLRFPILLKEDNELIDGLRRMEAMRLAGFTTVEVFVAHSFEQAIGALTASHADSPPRQLNYPQWRIYQIWRALDGMPVTRRIGRPGTHPSRIALQQALRLSSQNVLQTAVFIYRAAQEDSEEGEIARQAVAEIEAGRINGYGARIRIYKWRRDRKLLRESPLTLPQVKRIVTNATTQLLGTAKALEEIHRKLVAQAFTPEEAAELWTDFSRVQRALSPIGVELLKLRGEIK
jgi:hypothetical protein